VDDWENILFFSSMCWDQNKMRRFCEEGKKKKKGKEEALLEIRNLAAFGN